MNDPQRAPVVAALVVGLLFVPAVKGAAFTGKGVQNNPITICFIGNALTAVPDRVASIRSFLPEFEAAANIQFTDQGICSASSAGAGGDNDFFAGDIRLWVAGASGGVAVGDPIPGKGCCKKENGDTRVEISASWGQSPNSLGRCRSCRYNLKFSSRWGDRKLVLHEFGHSLGLTHEHKRADVTPEPTCSHPKYGGKASYYLTPYDRKSVMHYRMPQETCAAVYNKTALPHAGLSRYDRLALRILYPNPSMPAEFWGPTVMLNTGSNTLKLLWKHQGAVMNKVLSPTRPTWKVGRITKKGTSVTFSISSPGDYPMTLRFTDFLHRTFTYSGTMKVMTPAAFNKVMGATSAIITLPLQ